MGARAAAASWAAGMAVLGAVAGGAGAARAEGRSFQGTWRVQATVKGLDTSGSGTLRLRLDDDAGTFTCTLTGEGRGQGTLSGPDGEVDVQAFNSLAADRCSGTFDPAAGTLTGTLDVAETYRATMTARKAAEDDGEAPGPKTATRKGVNRFPATIQGTVTGGAASGRIVDDDGVVWPWKATGPAAGGEDAPADPPDAAEGPATGEDGEEDVLRLLFGDGGLDDLDEEALARLLFGDEGRPKAAPGEEDVARASLKSVLAGVAGEEARRAVAGGFFAWKAEQVAKDLAALEAQLAALAKRPEEPAEEADGWSWTDPEAYGSAKEQAAKVATGLKAAGSGAAEAAEKAAKAAEILEDVAKVRQALEEADTKVAEGRLTEGRARVLKGGTLLGKALKAVTAWIPMLGGTASEATDKTFEAGLKTGSKRAERATALERCKEDPLSEACMKLIDEGVITGY